MALAVPSSAESPAASPPAAPVPPAPPTPPTPPKAPASDEPPFADTPEVPLAWVECPRCRPEHWTADPARPFAALRGDGGYLYLKPRLSFGYGKPFATWGGLELVPLVTPDYVAAYGGLRLVIDWFELRAGARYVHAFLRQFLAPKSSYTLVDVAAATGHPSNYLDLDAELSANIPAGPGAILVLGTVSSIQNVTPGYYVYDEALRAVVDPPAVYRARLGYSLALLPEGNLHVGVVGEALEIPDRKTQVFRTGLTATFDIDDHLSALATVVVPVVTPDSIGLLGADYSELGVRYRWASGHTHEPEEHVPISASR
jgi:hypothetical protein